jgi:Tfp pilus assembly protein PilF
MHVKRHLSFAQGYLELGMIVEAAAELEHVPVVARESLEFIAVRLALLQEQKNWPALSAVAGELVRRSPAEAAAWVTWAYATRRADSLLAAEKILREAEQHHPEEPTIQFNLGCYACQRGDLVEARRRVQRAITLEPKFATSAETDPDLAALRAADATDCQPAP